MTLDEEIAQAVPDDPKGTLSWYAKDTRARVRALVTRNVAAAMKDFAKMNADAEARGAREAMMGLAFWLGAEIDRENRLGGKTATMRYILAKVEALVALEELEEEDG